MKNYFASFLLLLSVAGTLVSCREESRLPAPKLSGSVPLLIPEVSKDTAKAYFNYARARASTNNLANQSNPTRPVFEFTFSLDNTRDKTVKTVEVYKTFVRSGVLGPRVLAGSYSSFPATVSLNSQEALTGLQRLISQLPSLPYLLDVKGATNSATNAIFRDDAILFTFEYILEDGSRVVLTPVTKTTVGSTPGGVAPASPTVDVLANTTQINAPFSIKAVFRDHF